MAGCLAFGKITGVPVVLNTSFNDREPMVETPADALATSRPPIWTPCAWATTSCRKGATRGCTGRSARRWS
ncbi:carbamoyltransferase C-terminal domain-containing protein [Acrocarpospora macrocephala]|uniref:carbamoyltransferase C-terminal domain-containing protein n=1 Tax=Acrocarpospora macrocephala TaxID=150177 RepID=UPI0035A25DAA